MLKYSHKADQGRLVYDTMLRVNEILGTKSTCRYYLDHGYPAIGFGASSKALLSDCYELLYPLGGKRFTKRLLLGLGLPELAYFFMDDGSLEVRNRIKPKPKVERSAWLAISHNLEEVDLVNEWINGLTGALGRVARHKTGMLYLRWHSLQCRLLVESIRSYVHPCVAYKVDLNRLCTVKEWLMDNQHVIDISGLPIQGREKRSGPSTLYPITLEGLSRLDYDIEHAGGISRLSHSIGCHRISVSRHRDKILSELIRCGLLDPTKVPKRPRARSGGPSDLYPLTQEGFDKLNSDISEAGSMAKLAVRLNCTAPALGELRARITLAVRNG